MSAALAKPPPAVLGILAIGALWWLSQRRGATARTGNPAFGTEAAVQSPATRAYLIRSSGTAPTAPNPLQSLLSAGLALIGRNPNATPGIAPQNAVSGYSYGGPSTGVYGAPPQATQDLVNTYSYGGPSMGIYGNTAGNSGPSGLSQDYYGVITSPDTFTGDPYNDGGGNYDTVVASPPNWQYGPGEDLSNPI